MKKWILFACVLGSAPSFAAVDQFYRLFNVPAERADPAVLKQLEKMQQVCFVSEMSRIGPTPEQRKRCEAAVSAVLSRPREAALAALVRLDVPPPHGEFRLYDVIARAGELTVIEPMIAALERLEARGNGSERFWEKEMISQTLRRLTYADPKGTPAIAWRAWWKDHQGQSRDGLVAARIVEARTQLGAAFDTAYKAVEFLARQPATRDEAARAIDSMRQRSELSDKERQRLTALKSSLAASPQS